MTVSLRLQGLQINIAAEHHECLSWVIFCPFAEDYLLLPPNRPAERGAEAAVSGFQELLDAGWNNITLETVEVGSEGGLGYHVGQYSADVPTNDGGTKREKGNYIDIYKRQPDGSWKIKVTMFNSDEPA